MCRPLVCKDQAGRCKSAMSETIVNVSRSAGCPDSYTAVSSHHRQWHVQYRSNRLHSPTSWIRRVGRDETFRSLASGTYRTDRARVLVGNVRIRSRPGSPEPDSIAVHEWTWPIWSGGTSHKASVAAHLSVSMSHRTAVRLGDSSIDMMHFAPPSTPTCYLLLAI